MSSSKKRQLIFLQLIAAFIISAVSCNSKTTDDETDIVVTPAIVAVKNFHIQAKESVTANLDSVFFSIDLKSGVIFNADSLPKGTDVSRLIPVITFANTMSQADLIFTKDPGLDTEEETTVNYLTSPSDSIDFTKPVTLSVTAQDGLNTFDYIIKVNVHKVEPDSLVWNKLASSPLPYRFANPQSQKTIIKDDIVYCFIEENNGQYTLALSEDLNQENPWESKKAYDFGFTPNLQTLTVTSYASYILSSDGTLYFSDDLNTWTATSENWATLIGAYGEAVIGLKATGNTYLYAEYPLSDNFLENEIETDFPVSGFSALGLVETSWSDYPIAIFAGGKLMNGNYSSAVWGFDGTNWTILNEGVLPALNYPMMTRYVVYRNTQQVLTQKEFDIWLLFGGYTPEGEMNREVYMSYDNGVHWTLAPDPMQLSGKVPDVSAADLIVANYTQSTDLEDAWTRSSYTIEGTTVYWNCPFLYIFGGYNSRSSLNTNIYRGVLQRLKFTPSV